MANVYALRDRIAELEGEVAAMAEVRAALVLDNEELKQEVARLTAERDAALRNSALSADVAKIANAENVALRTRVRALEVLRVLDQRLHGGTH